MRRALFLYLPEVGINCIVNQTLMKIKNWKKCGEVLSQLEGQNRTVTGVTLFHDDKCLDNLQSKMLLNLFKKKGS